MHRTRFSTYFPMIVCIIGTLLLSGFQPTPIEAAEEAKSSVSLSIDFGDDSQLSFTRLAWHDKMTALDALAASAKHARGVEYKVRGSGAIAFVTEIDGQPNEGGGGRNWIFKINGKLAKVGAGAKQLKPGDKVQWLFARYDD